MTRSGEQFASLPSGIDICYETFGDPDNPAILLVMVVTLVAEYIMTIIENRLAKWRPQQQMDVQ